MKFLNQNAHWLLRIALASVFIFHGALKLMNLEGFAQLLPISYTEVVLVALAETGGGGFEFQAVLLLIMLFLLITGNRGFANTQTAVAA